MKTTLIKTFLMLLLFVSGSAPDELAMVEETQSEAIEAQPEEPYEVRKLKLNIELLQLDIGILQREIKKEIDSQ